MPEGRCDEAKTKQDLAELLPKRLVLAAEYADFLHISKPALYVRHLRGELAQALPGTGRSLRWTPQAIAAFHAAPKAAKVSP